MLVGYNVDGDKHHHIVEVDSEDHVASISAVKDMLKDEDIKAARVLAVIQGGKTDAPPVLVLPPSVA